MTTKAQHDITEIRSYACIELKCDACEWWQHITRKDAKQDDRAVKRLVRSHQRKAKAKEGKR